MKGNANDTETKILEAAKSVFFKKGLKGTRMQEIADVAGINRALLNYYFRTKDKLYKKVLVDTMEEMTPVFQHRLLETLTLRQFVEVMVNLLVDTNLTSPSFHLFYVITLNENPEMFMNFFEKTFSMQNPMDSLIEKIEEAIRVEEVRPLNPEQLIWSIVSLCSYTFLMQPWIKSFKDKTDLEMNAFFVQRKKETVDLIWNGIKK